jgi:hypothetical protein
VQAHLMLENTLADYIKLTKNLKKGVKEFMEGKGLETKFYTVFKELHTSAELGNALDRQMLVDIVEGIDDRSFRSFPGYDSLTDSRKMKKNFKLSNK